MTYILFIISLGLLFIAQGLDKLTMSKHISEKLFSFVYFLKKLCTAFALQIFLFAIVQFLVIEVTGFNLYGYLAKFEYFWLCALGYILFFIFTKYRAWNINNSFLYIRNVRFNHENHERAIQHLNELLFRCSAQLEISEKKLSLLKSFSPIPVALLVLNNLPQNFILYTDIKSFVFQNQLNLGLLVILGFYTYHIVSTFSAQKNVILNIAEIKTELYLLDTSQKSTSIPNNEDNS